jgi:hypothetical protein
MEALRGTASYSKLPLLLLGTRAGLQRALRMAGPVGIMKTHVPPPQVVLDRKDATRLGILVQPLHAVARHRPYARRPAGLRSSITLPIVPKQ